MKTLVVRPESAGPTDEQVIEAIDAYEAQIDGIVRQQRR
jgi:hypothetical protein